MPLLQPDHLKSHGYGPVRVFQVDVLVLCDAIIKGTVMVMNKSLGSSIAVRHTQPEISDFTTSSQYELSVDVASVCELPESVVTDTLTTEISLLKPNGAVFKGDVHSKLDYTS